MKHPRGKPRSIQKVATDLRTVIIIEIVERLHRSMAARRSAATKICNKALRQAQKLRSISPNGIKFVNHARPSRRYMNLTKRTLTSRPASISLRGSDHSFRSQILVGRFYNFRSTRHNIFATRLLVAHERRLRNKRSA
jgi:hypothetical protein